MSVEPRNIALKRIHDAPADDDGCRVLVDRLWPRGVSTERARLDAWLKEVAPSTELRRWFHNGGGFDEFALRYRAELDGNPASVQAVTELRALAAERAPVRVTLLYGARERRDNHARVLAEYLGADLAEPAEAPAPD